MYNEDVCYIQEIVRDKNPFMYVQLLVKRRQMHVVLSYNFRNYYSSISRLMLNFITGILILVVVVGLSD